MPTPKEISVAYNGLLNADKPIKDHWDIFYNSLPAEVQSDIHDPVAARNLLRSFTPKQREQYMDFYLALPAEQARYADTLFGEPPVQDVIHTVRSRLLTVYGALFNSAISSELSTCFETSSVGSLLEALSLASKDLSFSVSAASEEIKGLRRRID